ncbi:MAG: FHA domain-containing protein [Pseudomonadota bacterium]|nr:FHA domain-containing protein [Pseudomonadota bacterium]
MPKVIISMEGIIIKEFQLSKDRTSLGRRPYNDIVIDNLAISGEHAVLQLSGHEVYIEDLNSTNGTYVNGKTVKKQMLENHDVIEIGKYRIQYVNEAASPAEGIDATSTGTALIRVMSGSAAGREVALLKVVTTIGKPGIAVAAITKRPHGFVLAHVEGAKRVTLNGMPVGDEPMAMKNGDMIELAGTQMEFAHY